jgi:potassium efflux system protein
MSRVKSKNLVLLVILIVLIIASTLVPISSFPKGPLHITLQAVKSCLIILAWVFFYYLLKASFFERYKHVYKKEIPRIVLMITRFLVLVSAVLSVIVFVLGQSIFSIMALGGLLSAGLTFALGELILDAFAGLILETESPFEINDWIKVPDGGEGKVIAINWRTVILQSRSEYLIIVPHRKMAQGFINYSKPKRSYWEAVEISLDHSIPIDRAERILRAGVMVVPSIHDKKCDVVAIKANESGIVYEVSYMVPDVGMSRQVKHDVLDYVIRHLHKNKMRISETIGEYAISQGGKPFQEESPLTVEYLLNQVDLFSKLPKSVITQLSQKAVRHLFAGGEKIVKEGEEGQSLFLIGEGLVEVSIAYKNNAGAMREKELFRLGFPEYFGEMALFLNDKRSATVTAAMNTVVYEISQDLLKRVLKDNPKAFENLKKLARERKEKNKLTKSEMEKMKEKKDTHSKGLLANIKKFFK